MKKIIFIFIAIVTCSINSFAMKSDCKSELVICKNDNVLVIWSDGSKGVHQVIATSNNHTNIQIAEYSWIMGGEAWIASTNARKIVNYKDGISVGQQVQVKYKDGSAGTYTVGNLAGEYIEIHSNHSSSVRWVKRDLVNIID